MFIGEVTNALVGDNGDGVVGDELVGSLVFRRSVTADGDSLMSGDKSPHAGVACDESLEVGLPLLDLAEVPFCSEDIVAMLDQIE